MKERAIYILANDAVAEWLIALLKSIRKHLPEAKVRLIPFDSRVERVCPVAAHFAVELFEHESFPWLEEIGSRLEIGRTPLGPNWFRRFAVFLEEPGTFLYLDARTLLLSELRAGFEAVDSGIVDFVHFGGDPCQSFESGSLRSSLATTGRCFGFNSGMWVSKGGLFSRHDMERVSEFCIANRSQLNPRNTDQFFLNVLCAHSTARVVNYADLDGKVARDPWAFAHAKVFSRDNSVRVWGHGGMSHGRMLPLVHWAGIPLSSAMPLRRLWTEYRYEGNRPLGVRLEPLTSLPARASNWGRSSLFVRRLVSPANAGLK